MPTEQCRKSSFPFTTNTDVGIQVGQDAFRKDAVTSTADNDSRRRRSAAGRNDLPPARQQKARRLHVLVIDVSDRDTEHVWRDLIYPLKNLSIRIGIRTQRQQPHTMAGTHSRS